MKVAKNGFLKKETECIMLVNLEKVLRTNSIKFSTDEVSDTPLCRLCGINNETIRHVTGRCSKLAQKEYRKRHGKVTVHFHWERRKNYRLEASSK